MKAQEVARLEEQEAARVKAENELLKKEVENYEEVTLQLRLHWIC